MKTQIKPCPKCNLKAGWYQNTRHTYSQFYDSNGNPDWATVGESKFYKKCFCAQCGSDIIKCIQGVTE